MERFKRRDGWLMEEFRGESKICTWCDTEKYLIDFYSRKTRNKTKGEYTYYNPECKECTKSSFSKWRRKPENRERVLASRKRSNQLPSHKITKRAANAKLRESGQYREWQQNNKDRLYEYGKNRREHKEHDISDQEWFECLDYFKISCAYCGLSEEEHVRKHGQQLHKEHVEHEGVNDITNCIPSCKVCNGGKWEYELNEWYNSENPIYSKVRYNRIVKWLLSFSEQV